MSNGETSLGLPKIHSEPKPERRSPSRYSIVRVFDSLWLYLCVWVCVFFFLLGFFQFKFIECSFVNPKQIISLVAYVQNQMSANFFFFFFSLFNLIGSSLFYSPECGREKKVKQLRDPQGCLTQCFRRCIQMVWFNSHRRESGTITSFCCEWYGSTGDNFTLATSSC